MADDMDVDSDISDQPTQTNFFCSSCGSSTRPSHLRTDVHYSAFRDFRNQADEALRNAFPVHRKPRNTTASVLLLKWKDDDLGVARELRQLRDVFAQSYNFETEIYDIPSQNSDRELAYKIYEWRDQYCERNLSPGQQLPLLVLYYGGHAEESPKNTSIWRSNASVTNSSSLNWTTIQPILFDDAHADVLVLLDCCYAGCARFRAASTGRGTKEILAACSNKLPTTSVEYRSFTSVLIDELNGAAVENQKRGDPLTAVELHSYMHDNRKLQYQPIYAQVNRNRYHTISLIPFPILPESSARELSPYDSDSWSVVSDGRPQPSHKPTRVLLAIHTSRSPTEDLIGFLKNECMLPLYVTGMKIEDVINIEGIYESESSLALISVPLPIWHLLPDHPACRYIGKIKTKNLCQETLVQHLFQQVQNSSKFSSINENRNISLGAKGTQLLEQDLENSASNQIKKKRGLNEENLAFESIKVTWPAFISSSGDKEAVSTTNAMVPVKATSLGMLPPDEGESHEPSWKKVRASGPEMPRTPPESLSGDLPATDLWTEIGRFLYVENHLHDKLEISESVLDLPEMTDLWGGPWFKVEQSDTPAEKEWPPSMSNDQKQSESLTWRPQKNIPETDPTSSTIVPRKTGRRTGTLSSLQRRNAQIMRKRHSCFRCFMMRENCCLNEQSMLDGTCQRCRELENKMRTFRLPCSLIGLEERARYVLPEVLWTHLKRSRVHDYIRSHVSALVPNSLINLSLTVGFGSLLVLQAVEVVPVDIELAKMRTYVLAENGRLQLLMLDSPPVLPLLVDCKSIKGHFNRWLDSAICDEKASFLEMSFPEAHESWQREILDIIIHCYQNNLSKLEENGMGPSHTLRRALKWMVLNQIMSHPLRIPDKEVVTLVHQLQRYQPSESPKCLAPRFANLVLKSMMFPILNGLIISVCGELQKLLQTRGNEEKLWEPLFSIVFLCLLIISKTQVSLVEHAATMMETGDSSYTAAQASIDIKMMDQELSLHLIGMFHLRFRTDTKGYGKAFNPFAKNHQNPTQISALMQSILFATKAYGHFAVGDLSTSDVAEMKGKNMMRLLAIFMEPFGIEAGSLAAPSPDSDGS